MCQSMINIQSLTAEIRRGKKRRKKERNRMKIWTNNTNKLHQKKTHEMLNLNKCTKTKPKPSSLTTAHMYMHAIVHNCRTQHRTVLIIFPPILQTIIIAQMMSTGGDRVPPKREPFGDNWNSRPTSSVKAEQEYFSKIWTALHFALHWRDANKDKMKDMLQPEITDL